MSRDWSKDINEMHKKYGVHDWVLANKGKLRDYLKFRIDFLEEELNETRKAFKENDAEEVVDGLIDLCVVAIGTLDAFGVNAHEAWDRVHRANMTKEVGVKKERPNPLGLPDLVKPEGWTAPSHEGNYGFLEEVK